MYGIPCRGDGIEIRVDVDAWLDRPTRRSGRRRFVRPQRFVDQVARFVEVADHRDVRRAGRILVELNGRHHEIGGRARYERNAAECDGPSARHGRVVIEVGQEVGGLVDGDGCGDASPGDPDGVAHEQHTVAAGDVVEVDEPIEVRRQRASDGSHRSRVATINCVSPPDSWAWRASAKPADRSDTSSSSGVGR